jgi:hypothetical protein
VFACSAAGSSSDLDGEKLPVPYRDETRREIGVGFSECDERGHLLPVRNRVIDHKQTARPKHTLQVWPPTRILRPLSIEEDQVKRCVDSAFERSTGVVVNERDEFCRAKPTL